MTCRDYYYGNPSNIRNTNRTIAEWLLLPYTDTSSERNLAAMKYGQHARRTSPNRQSSLRSILCCPFWHSFAAAWQQLPYERAVHAPWGIPVASQENAQIHAVPHRPPRHRSFAPHSQSRQCILRWNACPARLCNCSR